MRQEAPYPTVLAELVDQCGYRPGWTVRLEDIDRSQDSAGLTLIITTKGYDSYHPDRGEGYRVNHYMPVPPAAYDRRSWQRWLFDQFRLVELHECMEFFTIAGGKPYAPSHGPGNDCYLVREIGSEADQRMAYTGDLRDTPARMPDPEGNP